MISPQPILSSSQIPVANRFGPLIRNKNPSSSSSLDSGPLFPPGFESSIPVATKIYIENRRKRKLKKKREKRKHKIIPFVPSPTQNPPNIPYITPDNILRFGKRIGLQFDGSQEELKARVEEILFNQEADWLSNQA